MIFAFDTYYAGNTAKTVCIGFEHWQSTDFSFCKIYTSIVPDEYFSGEFYKRELPGMLALIGEMAVNEQDIIIVDGFVVLDDEGKPGLGWRFYEALGRKIPVVGIAKSNFATVVRLKREVIRGDSKKPLYVTAAGVDLEFASEQVRQMGGDFRIPDLLKKLDLLTKED